MLKKTPVMCAMVAAASLWLGCMGGSYGGGFSGELPASMQGPASGPAEGERAMAWNLHYTAPAGWRTQDLGSVTVHGSADTSRAIFVGRALFRSYDEALVTTAALTRSLGLTTTGVLQPPTEGTVAGLRATSAVYAGFNAAGYPAQGRLLVLFTEHGTSLALFGLSDPTAAAEVSSVMDTMASSVRAGAPTVNADAARALAGRWVYSDGSYRSSRTSTSNRGVEATLRLDGAGGFQFSSTSWVSVDVRRTPAGESPVDLGTAESSRGFQDAGQYVVIGRELVLRGTQGQLVLPFALQGSVLTLGTTPYGRS